MPSDKTSIIEDLFRRRWNPKTKAISNPVVTLQDISQAIERYNRAHPRLRPMSTRNTANFFKDFIRNRKQANINWPSSVLAAGFTAKQVTGQGRCLEFVPIAPGQTTAFPVGAIPGPSAATARREVESVSLPLVSRRLGRAEETWITQVVVRLRIVETHLALYSPRRNQIVQVDHLQMSIKLPAAEIDASYLVLENGPTPTQEVIATCEAKGLRDDLLEGQIITQVKAVFGLRTITQNLVIPIGIKVVGPSELYLVEFQPVDRPTAPTLTALAMASDALYVLKPPVPGIG